MWGLKKFIISKMYFFDRLNAPVHLAQGFPESSKHRCIPLTQNLLKRRGPFDLVKPVAM